MRNPLSARDALNIAAQHGLSIHTSGWHRKMIRDGIIAAREAEAKPTTLPRKTAVRHFDDSMIILMKLHEC